MAALSNSALVYLFEPRLTSAQSGFGGRRFGTILDASSASNNLTADASIESAVSFNFKSILLPALMVALSSSHAYLLARLLIRHLLRRAFWKGSKEERQAKEADAEVKRVYIRNLVSSSEGAEKEGLTQEKNEDTTFWGRDDGAYELQSITKEL